MAENNGELLVDYISGIEVRATPEEKDAVQPFSKKLVEDYHYPKESIIVHPQWHVRARPSDTKKEYPVDIMVFDGEACFENEYIIVECKKKNRKDGKIQLESYLKFSNARLGVWYNGNDVLYLRKIEGADGRLQFEQIPNIPSYQQRVEDVGKFKRSDLIKTHNLKTIFKSIRNYLAANNKGQTLDTEFVSQIINLLFCKIYDEKFTKMDEPVRFRAGLEEDPEIIYKRVLDIFKNVKNKYPDVFDEKDHIVLSVNSVVYIVGELQQYSLIECERDVIADAFETFISPSLRGGQGQFFTPRNVVKLVLELTNPTSKDRIIDPACGSGGFLIEALKRVWHEVNERCIALGWPEREIMIELQDTAIKNFRGIDKENYLSKTTKAYMAILGDGRGGIFCDNSLDKANWSDKLKMSISDGSFDVVLTNPPFGSKLKIDDSSILSQYDLGYQWKDDGKGNYEKTNKVLDEQTPQILFVEKCLDLLKEGGRLGIVLPESMFSNSTQRYVVAYMEKRARIDAIISLPEELFQPNTHAKTCVAILTKQEKTPVEDHDVFMAIAKWCGHDSRANEIPYDDVPDIQQNYVNYKNGLYKGYDHKGFILKSSQIVNHIYIASYYNPDIITELQSLSKDYDLVTVQSLIDDGLMSIGTGKEVGKLAYGTGNIPFVRTSDIANWEIKLDPKKGISEEIYDKLKKKTDVRPKDILMVKDGSYLIGTCAFISEEETKITFQSHIYKIRSLDHEKLNPYLLLAILSSPIVKKQIRAKQFSQDIIDTLGSRIRELVLPIPKNESKRKEIITQVMSVFEMRNKARKVMKSTILGVTPIHDFDEDDPFLTIQ